MHSKNSIDDVDATSTAAAADTLPPSTGRRPHLRSDGSPPAPVIRGTEDVAQPHVPPPRRPQMSRSTRLITKGAHPSSRTPRMRILLLGGPQEKMPFFQIASGPILSIPIHSKVCLYGPCKFWLIKNDPFLTYRPPKVSIFCRCSHLVNSPLLLAIWSVVIQHSYGKF